MTEALKTELANQIAQKHALVVVGTGVSLAATGGNELASWKGLIASGIKRCVDINLCKPTWAASQKDLLEGDLDDLLGVAEQVSRRLGWEPTEPCGGEWNKWLRKTAGALRASQPELIQAIRDLDAPIATLNYDNLLTEVTGRRPITWKNAERWLPVLQGNDEAILHLHGHWDQPSSVVLGIRSYDAVMGKELAQHLQRVLASLHSLVFMGCSGTVQDPNFSALIGWMRDQLCGAEHSHYLLLRESEPPPIDASLLRQARIVTLRYGAAHADLLSFIRSLAPSSRAEEPIPDPAARKYNGLLDDPVSAVAGVAGGGVAQGARPVRKSRQRDESREPDGIGKRLLTYPITFIEELFHLVSGPKRFIAQRRAEGTLTIGRAFGFLAFSKLIMWSVPPHGLAIFTSDIFFMIAQVMMFALSLVVAWRIVGGSASLLDYLPVHFYYSSIFSLLILFGNRILLAILKTTDEKIYKDVMNAVMTGSLAYFKELALDAPAPVLIVMAVGFMITYALLLGWFVAGWGAYRVLNGVSRRRSLVAALIFLALSVPVFATLGLVAFALQAALTS